MTAQDMLRELQQDNEALVISLKALKELAEDAGDNATDGVLDDWTDEAEQRANLFANSAFGTRLYYSARVTLLAEYLPR